LNFHSGSPIIASVNFVPEGDTTNYNTTLPNEG